MENKIQVANTQMMPTCEHKNKVLKVHFSYVAGILVVVGLAIFSWAIWGKINGSTLGIIATVTSIILSVLAIFMTVISNDSTSNLMHRIRDTSEGLNGLSENIGQAVQGLEVSADKLKKLDNLDKIDQLDELKKLDALSLLSQLDKLGELNKLEHITDKLCAIEDGQNEQRADLYTIREGMNIHTKAAKESLNSFDISNDTVQLPSDDTVQSFFATTSRFGVLFLYGLSTCCLLKKKFNLKDFSVVALQEYELQNDKQRVDANVQYLWGFLMCLSAIPGYVDIKEDGDLCYIVESVHPYIEKNISNNKNLEGKVRGYIDEFVKKSPSIDGSSNEEEKK